MAFTKIVSPGIDTTGSYTVQELNTVGVMTAGTVQVGSATTVHSTGIDLGSGNITSHNINSTGIITATSFVGPVSATNGTFSGNVSIGGTLTYEDVTNVDSIGIITARNGLHVTSGSVGIGTDNPDQTLHLYDSTAFASFTNNADTGESGILFRRHDNNQNRGKVTYSFTDDALLFRASSDGSGEDLRITSSGVVGINTDVSGNGSGAKLVVGGRIQSNTGGYWFAGANGAEDGWHVQDSGGNFVVVESGVAERLRITSDGKIGINTASPRAVLDIEGNAENATLMLHSNDANANLQFSDNTGGARILNYGGDLAFRTGTNAHVFGTGDSEALRIKSNGNIGINTDNPQNALHISGSSPTIRFEDTGANGSAFSVIEDNDGLFKIRNDAGNSGTGSGIAFEVDAAEALRISSSGKIGINTASPFAELDIISTTETTTGTLSQHGIRLSAPGAADGEVIPITGGFLSNQDRARAGIGFISRVAGSSVGYAGAIGFYTRSSADGNGLLRTDEKVRINESGTLIVDAGGEAQDIQIISHSAASGHGKIYLRGNASSESSSIQLNHYGHADYHISAGRAANGLFSITRTDGGSDGIIMNANGNVGIKNTGTSSKLHIGDLVSDVANDIDTTNTSLIIKQTSNDNKGGIYIERSGERKGYSIWLNPGGGAGDGLTFTRNNAGTKSDALILDRDANLTVGGDIYPSLNNNYDLGSTSNAWRNVYTNDLHLSNMSGGGNDVDGTTGDWTIQEGEENLYIINNRSGKKYKFNLQEVN